MGMDSGVALSKSTTWVTLEAMVRDAVQTLLQRALETELTEHLGRAWYERRAVVDAPVGYRNGHGKPRRLALSCGTVTLRRPRMRDLEQRFVSRLPPLFVRRTTEVGTVAERTFRRIDGHEWMAKVADGRRFVDGHEVSRPRATKRAA